MPLILFVLYRLVFLVYLSVDHIDQTGLRASAFKDNSNITVFWMSIDIFET